MIDKQYQISVGEKKIYTENWGDWLKTATIVTATAALSGTSKILVTDVTHDDSVVSYTVEGIAQGSEDVTITMTSSTPEIDKATLRFMVAA